MKKIVTLLFTLVLLSTPAFAEGWTDDLKAKVQNEYLQTFDAMDEKDADKAVALIPEGILKYFAESSKVPVDEFRLKIREIFSLGFKTVKSITVEIDKEKSVYRQAPNGELYALIPYKMNMVSIDGDTDDDDSLALAIQIDDKWYFMDIEKPINLKALKTAYPQFVDLDVSMPESDQRSD